MAINKDIQYDKDYSTKYDGVYFRYSRKKKHNGKPDKSFKIRYRLNGRSKNEKIGWLSDGISAEFARNIRSERVVSIRHGNDLPNTKQLTFREAAKRYIDDHENNKSIQQDKYRYNDLKILDDMEISNITVSDLKKVHASMRSRGVKHITYTKVESFYNRAVKYASKLNLIKSQESIRVPIPRVAHKVTEIYSDEMRENYLAVIEQYPYRVVSDIVELIYFTGMRRSEPLKLKWTDYNKEETYLTLRDAKSGRDEKKMLSTSSIEILERQRGKSKVYIFEHAHEAVKAPYLSYHARRMADMAGLPRDYRPLHSLRHNVGTVMAMNGVPVAIIKEQMNHKNIETTQRYIDIADEAVQEHVNNLETGLKKSSKMNVYIKKIDTRIKND
ncbi:tyrosine-type recombinase/integrase [Sulfurimonas sp.]|uniref:tyrosine-type recombinase/integrase n=1 Tax=Sulfurimonas sp. TaxID=2022749 RepID=UPI0035638541